MAITQVYVDPAINFNSGTGTIGDPYGDLQYALNTQTRDATNGDQFNVKAGTAEILAASLSLTTYGAPTVSAPLVIRGYTATANDGGIGEIDAGGNTLLASAAVEYVGLVDLNLHNFGNHEGVASYGGGCFIHHCSVHKGASTPVNKQLILYIRSVTSCHVYNAGTGGYGIYGSISVIGNYVVDCPTGIMETGAAVVNNIVVDCPTYGILAQTNSASVVIGNTVYSSTAATGKGIHCFANRYILQITNNIVVGYSGAGGIGISVAGAVEVIGYNAFYNNTTAKSITTVGLDLGNDVTLGASPFTNAAGGDFSVGTTLKALGWPASFLGASTNTYVDIGAAQRTEPAATAVLDSAGGTYHAPSASEVISTAVFGPSSGTSGTFVVPPVAKVEAGYTYGVADALEGELVATSAGARSIVIGGGGIVIS